MKLFSITHWVRWVRKWCFGIDESAPKQIAAPTNNNTTWQVKPSVVEPKKMTLDEQKAEIKKQKITNSSKEKAKQKYARAKKDLRVDVSKIDTAGVKFKLDEVETLVKYRGQYALDNSDKHKFRSYLKAVTSIKSGKKKQAVSADVMKTQQNELIQILDKYMQDYQL